MQDRDLIVGVLATQAGFVTPQQVMEAAASRLIGTDQRWAICNSHLQWRGGRGGSNRAL